MMNKPVKSLLLSAAFLICTSLTLAENTQAKPSRKHQIQGTFTIIRNINRENFLTTDGEDPSCFGHGGYDDLQLQVPVTVTDEQGKIIAVGQTEAGRETPNGCTMYYKIDNIPKASFYSVEVGRRGKLTYSFEDMKNSGWKVSSSIGEKYR